MVILTGCGKKDKERVDFRTVQRAGFTVHGPEVICPSRFCTIWVMPHPVKPIHGDSMCLYDPAGYDGPGRLIAVGPDDNRIVAVALGDGCYQPRGWGGWFTKGEVIR